MHDQKGVSLAVRGLGGGGGFMVDKVVSFSCTDSYHFSLAQSFNLCKAYIVFLWLRRMAYGLRWLPCLYILEAVYFSRIFLPFQYV